MRAQQNLMMTSPSAKETDMRIPMRRAVELPQQKLTKAGMSQTDLVTARLTGPSQCMLKRAGGPLQVECPWQD